MKWIHDYQLFLFDFDGILVNTEELHFKAYQKMCKDRGFTLSWDEKTYIQHAMYSSNGIKEAIYKDFPDLKRTAPNWEVLYAEKKKAYSELILKGVGFMPGVKEILSALKEAEIKRCVVTHSPIEQVAIIRKQNPILDSIPHWITREQYKEPKPSSECYEKAIALHANANDKIIGFEDSPRGLKALLATGARGVFISSVFDEKEVANLAIELGNSFSHFNSFDAFCEKMSG